jgi:hypothetical protein
MLKKIIFLLLTFFCSNILFTAQTPLTQLFKEGSSKSNIDNILKKNNMSAQELYNLLINRKNSLLLKDISSSMTKSRIETFVEKLGLFERPSGYGLSGGDLITIFIIALPLAIGIPILTTGLAIQQFMAPSHTKTVVSSGLIGAGGILSTPFALFGLATAAGKIEKLLKNIYYYSKVKEVNELDHIENDIKTLKWYYRITE